MSDYQFNPNVEQWKEIPGYPGYEVSDHGRVRSFYQQIPGGHLEFVRDIKPQRTLSPIRHKTGYLCVNLRKNKKSNRFSIHILVLTTFIGPRPIGCQCRHMDGKKSHNHLSNLKWGTPKENGEDKAQHGTAFRGGKPPVCIGMKHPGAKLTDGQVISIRRLYVQGFFQKNLGEFFGVTQTVIGDIVRHKSWTHLP